MFTTQKKAQQIAEKKEKKIFWKIMDKCAAPCDGDGVFSLG